MAYPEMQSGEGDFVSTIHQLADLNFFSALEMGTIISSKERAAVLQAARERNLKIAVGAQPLILGQNLNLNASDLQTRLDARIKIKEGIDQAAEIGAESFVILSGKDPGEAQRQQAYEFLEESIQGLAEHACQYAIRIVLEIFDRSVDKKALVGPSVEAAPLARKIRLSYPEFGLLYDMGHMPLLDERPAQALALLQGLLAEVHLGNCVLRPGATAFGDKHPRFGFDGGVNSTPELVSFLEALLATDYLKESQTSEDLPWVGFEIRPHGTETTAFILENIMETWKNAWEQVESRSQKY
jgi:sugar phosphate isomerase/epimerase